MDPKKIKFLVEKYEKENKNVFLQEEFIALPGADPITPKFYARHEVLKSVKVPEKYIQIVKKKYSTTPKDTYDFPPPAVNMEYGWFIEPLIPQTNDPRLNFKRNENEFIKTEIAIKEGQKKLPEKKFTGVPFKT